jgi:hypothetical protein
MMKSTAEIQSILNTEPLKEAATLIQRLWRGNQARKEIALTLPHLLTLQTKLKLWGTSSLPLQEIESKLFAVHATDFFPMNGVIRVVDPKKRREHSSFRPTTHFALGELVRPQCDGKITREHKKFAILTPLKDLLPQLLNIQFYDTYILGDFKLTNDSIVLVPAKEARSFQETHPNLNIVGYQLSRWNYDSSIGLRQAVKNIIMKQGGYDINLSENDDKQGLCAHVTFQSKPDNLNTPGFFSPILRQDRNVAFGGHWSSLFGDAYLFGVVDIALTQLGISSDYFYGYTYNEDPAFAKLLIEYALEKIASNPMVSKDCSESDVLKLHIMRAREGLKKLADSRERKSFSGDYTKARMARLLTWSDLLLLIHTNKRLALHLYNKSAFLCLYAFYRTQIVGEQGATNEGLTTVFSHNIDLLTESMYRSVIGTILSIRSNMTEKTIFPGGVSHLHRLILRAGKIAGIVFNPSDDLEIMANKICKHPNQWLPTTIDLPDNAGNVPLIQAIIVRDEQKALGLLNAGANIINVYGRIGFWSITVIPLLTVALRYGMTNFAQALLKQPDFLAWDQLDDRQNTPLCDAIAMGFEDIAISLIEKGARVNRRPSYADLREKDLVSLADRLGLVRVATLLRNRGCTPTQAEIEPESRQGCLIM